MFRWETREKWKSVDQSRKGHQLVYLEKAMQKHK